MTQISRTFIASIATMVLFAMAPSANATTGIDAARACESNPKCVSTFDKDGSVTIFVGTKVIQCAGPKAECTISRKHNAKNRETSFMGGNSGKNQDSNAGMNGGKDTGGGSGGSGGQSNGMTGSANTNNAGMSAGGGNSGTIN